MPLMRTMIQGRQVRSFIGRRTKLSETVIDDYAATAGLRRKENQGAVDGHQLGDPSRGAAAIVEIANLEDPPFRLLLGSDAVTRAEEDVVSQQAEVDRWRSTSLATDFPD